MMVPDIVSVTDGTTTDKLVDSAADFVTDKISIGDIIYNTTDLTQTTVTAIDDLNTLSVADDIFVSGESYRIHMLSPTGLNAFKANVGKVYNNSSSHLDDSRKHGEARITTSFWHTVNGYGSSSTKIQKFTTEVDASDNVVVTVANSATLGFTVTANTDCRISVTYANHSNTGTAGFGLSKNSTQLTTNINSITAAGRVGINTQVNGDQSQQCSWSGIMKKGDMDFRFI